MISLQQHIDQQYKGNVSAFAKTVVPTRPTVYRWLRNGALWINGRVFNPVTPALNIHILLVMQWLENPESVTKEQLRENATAADAYAAYADAYAAYAYAYATAADAAATAAAYATAADAAYAYAYVAAEKWVDEYFKHTGENKQDYLRELNNDHN